MTRLFTTFALALFLAAPAVAQASGADNAVVSLSEEMMESYVGSYTLQPGVLLHVTRNGDTLFAGAGQYDPYEMTVGSETEFFVLAIGAQITFNVAEDGSTESLTLNQNGVTIDAPRAE